MLVTLQTYKSRHILAGSMVAQLAVRQNVNLRQDEYVNSIASDCSKIGLRGLRGRLRGLPVRHLDLQAMGSMNGGSSCHSNTFRPSCKAEREAPALSMPNRIVTSCHACAMQQSFCTSDPGTASTGFKFGHTVFEISLSTGN